MRPILSLVSPSAIRSLAAARPIAARAVLHPSVSLNATQFRSFATSPFRAAEAESEKPASETEKAADKEAAEAGESEADNLRKLIEERDAQIKELEVRLLSWSCDPMV